MTYFITWNSTPRQTLFEDLSWHWSKKCKEPSDIVNYKDSDLYLLKNLIYECWKCHHKSICFITIMTKLIILPDKWKWKQSSDIVLYKGNYVIYLLKTPLYKFWKYPQELYGEKYTTYMRTEYVFL